MHIEIFQIFSSHCYFLVGAFTKIAKHGAEGILNTGCTLCGF
jgi:hypothetical protein